METSASVATWEEALEVISRVYSQGATRVWITVGDVHPTKSCSPEAKESCVAWMDSSPDWEVFHAGVLPTSYTPTSHPRIGKGGGKGFAFWLSRRGMESCLRIGGVTNLSQSWHFSPPLYYDRGVGSEYFFWLRNRYIRENQTYTAFVVLGFGILICLLWTATGATVTAGVLTVLFLLAVGYSTLTGE